MGRKIVAKCKRIWDTYGRWFLLGIPIAAVVISISVIQATRIMPTPFESSSQADISSSSEAVSPVEDTEDEFTSQGPVTEKVEYTVVEEQVWEDEDISLSTEDYTLPQEAVMADGSVGVLSIPKIHLEAPVYEAEDGGEMESMTKGVAHFAVTSAWDGNIGLCSHNVAPNGAVAYFRALHLLEVGDELSYKPDLGERSYAVTTVKEIQDDDWSYLMRYDDELNRITMITCITGKPDMRLMVQATEL